MQLAENPGVGFTMDTPSICLMGQASESSKVVLTSKEVTFIGSSYRMYN